MTVIGALSTFRKRREMSPHKRPPRRLAGPDLLCRMVGMSNPRDRPESISTPPNSKFRIHAQRAFVTPSMSSTARLGGVDTKFVQRDGDSLVSYSKRWLPGMDSNQGELDKILKAHNLLILQSRSSRQKPQNHDPGTKSVQNSFLR
jgi:hypothetical protein